MWQTGRNYLIRVFKTFSRERQRERKKKKLNESRTEENSVNVVIKKQQKV
jgi:hypothetical protein